MHHVTHSYDGFSGVVVKPIGYDLGNPTSLDGDTSIISADYWNTNCELGEMTDWHANETLTLGAGGGCNQANHIIQANRPIIVWDIGADDIPVDAVIKNAVCKIVITNQLGAHNSALNIKQHMCNIYRLEEPNDVDCRYATWCHSDNHTEWSEEGASEEYADIDLNIVTSFMLDDNYGDTGFPYVLEIPMTNIVQDAVACHDGSLPTLWWREDDLTETNCIGDPLGGGDNNLVSFASSQHTQYEPPSLYIDWFRTQ